MGRKGAARKTLEIKGRGAKVRARLVPPIRRDWERELVLHNLAKVTENAAGFKIRERQFDPRE